MRQLFTALLLLSCFTALAQSGDFPFGKILHNELGMKTYPADTSAAAVVLNEFGVAWVSDEYTVMFDYHVKIKILKKGGLKKGDFKIPLYGDGGNSGKSEKWLSLEAATYNYDGSKIKTSKLNKDGFFIEKANQYVSYVKFALPDVREGSVIEVKYSTESPYLFQLHTWQFQDDIPKMRTEFWSKIPANFDFGVTLRGFLKFSQQDGVLERSCFLASGASERSDCSVGKYVMTDVPAFIEEDFMTAPKNFISALYYELSKYTEPTGATTKYSEEWKDVDKQLKEHDFFGAKIKRSRKLMEDIIPSVIKSETDPLAKAQLIYNYIKDWYRWNEESDKYSDRDVKKVYETKIGNSAEINFALIGGLQAAGLNADPVMVSTRDNGIPFKGHPQRTTFNYVISSLKIGEQLYLLDATDPFLPFGVLPIRCLNDQGRLVSKDESSWVNLRTTQRFKSSVGMELTLNDQGQLKGSVKMLYYGYAAAEKRKEIAGSNQGDYLKSLSKEWNQATISNYTVEGKDDLDKALVEKVDIEFSNLDAASNMIYFNPFLAGRYERNPFKSSERLYPVDLGAPIESTYFISIALPEKYKVDEMPAYVAFALPQNTGKCLLNVSQVNNAVNLTSVINLSKPIYNSGEYQTLKEFFARVVQMQQSQFVFKAK